MEYFSLDTFYMETGSIFIPPSPVTAERHPQQNELLAELDAFRQKYSLSIGEVAQMGKIKMGEAIRLLTAETLEEEISAGLRAR